MVIKEFENINRASVVEILCEAFPWYYVTAEDADEGLNDILENKGILLVSIEDGRAVGIIGAVPQYGVTGWELHPFAVLKKYRGRGHGAGLVKALEQEIVKHKGVMVYLGSDDEFSTTSLFGVDLYEDTFDKIANIKNTGGHPYPFYEKQGYKIVGVFPDANGIGKPDIWMAKRLVEQKMRATHNMRLNHMPFEAIKSGSKTIEIRLNDEKRKAVKIGDAIVFTRIDGAAQIVVEVLARHEYKSFRELYEKFPPSICGSNYSSIDERLAETYANYYTKEQEAKNGALGIEIRLISG